MSQSALSCLGCKHALANAALFCSHCGRPKHRDMATDPLLGKLLGERFQIQARIGYGGTGIVYRAQHVTLGRNVAVKVLHEELSRDELALERLRREATTVTEIDNEHLVEIYDFGSTPDGRLYFAMELLEGESLDVALAREHRLSIERTANIAIQVGQALMEAHAIGYVHRDLRPRNIFLAVRHGKPDFVKLLDFGLAKLVDSDASASSTKLGMRFGDPRYMSPEQASGDRIDRRSDIYQLGCVAYEMLTGTPPFVGDRVLEVLTKQVVETPKPLPSRRRDVPLWMEAACAKMLAKDPLHRFVTVTRMIEALERGLQTGEVMTDDDARQRELVLPASVSRVMQRMGVPEAYVARPDVVARDAHPEAFTVSPEMSTGEGSAPESTQTGDSARWYDEGDRASDQGELANREQAWKLISPGTSDMSHWAAPTGRPRSALIAIGAIAVTAGIVLAVSYSRTDAPSASRSPMPAAVEQATPRDAAPQPTAAVGTNAAADETADASAAADAAATAPTERAQSPELATSPREASPRAQTVAEERAPLSKRAAKIKKSKGAQIPKPLSPARVVVPSEPSPSGAQIPTPIPSAPAISPAPAIYPARPSPDAAPSQAESASGTESRDGVSGTSGPLDPYGADPSTP